MNRRPTITEEQRAALQGKAGRPVYVVDANSHKQYVLPPADEYERYKALFETVPFDISDTFTAQEKAARQV